MMNRRALTAAIARHRRTDDEGLTLTPAAARAARVMVGIDSDDMDDLADLAHGRTRQFESGHHVDQVTALKLRRALAEAGIAFGGDGRPVQTSRSAEAA